MDYWIDWIQDVFRVDFSVSLSLITVLSFTTLIETEIVILPPL